MEHKIYPRYPLGNPHRVWRQDNFILSTFAAYGANMRGILELCADAGFSMVELGWANHQQAEDALRICEGLGLDLLYQDFSLYGGMQQNKMDREPIGTADVKSICDHIRPYRRTVGYYVWDEPHFDDQLMEARRQVDLFQNEDPTRLPFTVAIPSYNEEHTWYNGEFPKYLERYCTIIDPPVLSLDYYPIGLWNCYKDENQCDDSFMWLDLGLMRTLGRKYSMPIWFYYHGMNYTNYHRFTFPMIRMNMFSGVLYGAKALQQFTVIGSTVTSNGEPDIFFDEQKKIHREFKMLGSTLMALDNVNVIHSDDVLPGCEYMEGLSEKMEDSLLLTGTLPKRVSVGEFSDAYGNLYLMVLNRDFETDADITLDLKKTSRLYEVSKVNGRHEIIADSADQIKLTLEKGDAVLWRVQPAEEEPYTVEYRLEK